MGQIVHDCANAPRPDHPQLRAGGLCGSRLRCARQSQSDADCRARARPRRRLVRSRLLTRISEIPAAQWNALAGENPFLRHEFLDALEQTGCATAHSGWTPQHLVLVDQQGLAAAAPLYLKSHSWGEFVFDFAWARAAEQCGVAYYPKLVCAISFTPATGPRLLCRPGLAAEPLRAALLAALSERAQSEG